LSTNLFSSILKDNFPRASLQLEEQTGESIKSSSREKKSNVEEVNKVAKRKKQFPKYISRKHKANNL
jgi:hypothetical protein